MKIIRGHHLICQLGFKGKGYSREFVDNMSKVLNDLRKDRLALVMIVDKPDNICKYCPNLFQDQCFSDDKMSSEKRIKKMDQFVIKTLQININTPYYWQDIQNKIAENFTLHHMDILCKNCQWYKLQFCKEGLRNLKNISGKK